MSFDRASMVAQFDVAIDALERAIRRCPDELWEAPVWRVVKTDPHVWPAAGVEPIAERTEASIQAIAAFWAVAYHTLYFLDLDATSDRSDLTPPDYARGGPEERYPAPDGAAAIPGIHAPVFPRGVLLRFLDHGRAKVRRVVADISDAQLATPSGRNKTFEERLVESLAHVREHGSKLLAFVERAPTTSEPLGGTNR
jgi:hypothetical protein